jgi:hypothetical protein
MLDSASRLAVCEYKRDIALGKPPIPPLRAGGTKPVVAAPLYEISKVSVASRPQGGLLVDTGVAPLTALSFTIVLPSAMVYTLSVRDSMMIAHSFKGEEFGPAQNVRKSKWNSLPFSMASLYHLRIDQLLRPSPYPCPLVCRCMCGHRCMVQLIQWTANFGAKSWSRA